MHRGDPVEHAIVAIWQDPASAQDDPTEHGMQLPLLHTPPSPQGVPEYERPVGTQSAPPSLQIVMPVEHVAGEQALPVVHGAASTCVRASSPVLVSSTPASPASGMPESPWSTVESGPASMCAMAAPVPPLLLLVEPPLEPTGESGDTEASDPPPVAKSPRSEEHPADAAAATRSRPQTL